MEINRIYNMDCLDGMKEIKDKSVSMVLTDIPYGECSGFVMGGFRQINKDKADYVDFSISDMANELIRVCSGSIYVFCGANQFSEIIKTFRNGGMTCRTCVWEKTNPSPMNGQHLWLSSVECCVFGRFPKATFNEYCKSSVWRYPCGSSKIHPTQKPIELFKRLILASSNEGDLILDPFSGSGTTAIACNQLRRNFIAFEKNEEYYKVSIKRFKEETSQISIF
jgi:site-specific DNA-methyltransferase (adenine-specific)